MRKSKIGNVKKLIVKKRCAVLFCKLTKKKKLTIVIIEYSKSKKKNHSILRTSKNRLIAETSFSPWFDSSTLSIDGLPRAVIILMLTIHRVRGGWHVSRWHSLWKKKVKQKVPNGFLALNKQTTTDPYANYKRHVATQGSTLPLSKP